MKSSDGPDATHGPSVWHLRIRKCGTTSLSDIVKSQYLWHRNRIMSSCLSDIFAVHWTNMYLPSWNGGNLGKSQYPVQFPAYLASGAMELPVVMKSRHDRKRNKKNRPEACYEKVNERVPVFWYPRRYVIVGAALWCIEQLCSPAASHTFCTYQVTMRFVMQPVVNNTIRRMESHPGQSRNLRVTATSCCIVIAGDSLWNMMKQRHYSLLSNT